jgi:hypothetical protein
MKWIVTPNHGREGGCNGLLNLGQAWWDVFIRWHNSQPEMYFRTVASIAGQ